MSLRAFIIKKVVDRAQELCNFDEAQCREWFLDRQVHFKRLKTWQDLSHETMLAQFGTFHVDQSDYRQGLSYSVLISLKF